MLCDWVIMSFYSVGHFLRPLLRRSWVKVGLLWQNAAAKEHVIERWAGRYGKVIRVSCLYNSICFFQNWHFWSREVDFEYHMRVHTHGSLVGLHSAERSETPHFMQPRLYPASPSWWGRRQRLLPSTSSYCTVFEELFKLGRQRTSWLCCRGARCCLWVRYDGTGTIFLHSANLGVGWLQCYNPEMGQDSCRVLVQLSSVACRSVFHCSVVFVILLCFRISPSQSVEPLLSGIRLMVCGRGCFVGSH